ncbi:hypothetical protein [Nesterenkonia sphaerica]|uniref:Uncharacterized protein n=1 Tax=Nesterenkonia sphaerica TaxID=1804988 RepID=A0A5R9AMJ3_9MICC|nr:hypothetical protein [Nesterenkonia sphaerica]TLP80000.1 hypothetical protein FEF27_01050 [Nesterenkonia sphaerica]
MALIHTINAFLWPLLVAGSLLVVWRISASIRTRRGAPRSTMGDSDLLDLPPAAPGEEAPKG